MRPLTRDWSGVSGSSLPLYNRPWLPLQERVRLGHGPVSLWIQSNGALTYSCCSRRFSCLNQTNTARNVVARWRFPPSLFVTAGRTAHTCCITHLLHPAQSYISAPALGQKAVLGDLIM